jgi:response regulator RpfG family c-di-GMP phosphodiesterase
MTLFQDTGDDPRATRSLVAEVLAWCGATGDAAAGNAPGFAVRKAAVAVSIGKIADLPEGEAHAMYFAGLLHASGAIGNPAHRVGERLPERAARMERWDVPVRGAHLCAAIPALPLETADMVRWQHEAWDGTGYPDQLRWNGIPRSAQLLALADRYVRSPDPEDALAEIGMESGRAFSPEHVRTFALWYHSTPHDEIAATPVPLDALGDAEPGAQALLESLADRMDAHIGVAGRWRGVARIAETTAMTLGLEPESLRDLSLACRIFGAGEICGGAVEDDTFDPLARLGIEHRARNAKAAAALAEPFQALRGAAAIVAARGEWYDGTGKPHGLLHGRIPAGAGILAAAIAYSRLDRSERLDTAAGTQFDPKVVRAMMETKARA